MNKKMVKLQSRTITMIQHTTMRLAELNNILTVIDIYFQYIERKERLPLDILAIVKSLEKRIRTMEKHPDYAGHHEHHKTMPP